MINKSYIYLLLSQCAISANVVLGKFLIESFPLFFYLGFRFLFSSLFLLTLFKFKKATIKHPSYQAKGLTRSDWLYVVLQAFGAGFLFNVLFYWGLDYTTATSAGIIAASLPGVMTLLAFIFLKETLNRYKLIALLCVVLGIAILNMDNTSNIDNPVHGSYLGDFLIVLSIFPEASYSIFGKKVQGRVSSLGGAMMVSVFSFLMLLPLLGQSFFSISPLELSMGQMLLLMLGGFFSVCFFFFWNKGLEGVSVSTSALFWGVMPVATASFAIVFLDEPFTWIDLFGMLFVLCALFLGSRSYGKKQL